MVVPTIPFNKLIAVADECWKWKPNYLKWAESRLISFKEVGSSKFLVTSQGGLAKDEDNAETELQQIYTIQPTQCFFTSSSPK
jgi:hypothetical protein